MKDLTPEEIRKLLTEYEKKLFPDDPHDYGEERATPAKGGEEGE